MTAATKEAPQAAASPTREDDSHRSLALEEPLRNAQVLASLLARVIEGIERGPSMSKIERMVAREELDFVTEPLKNAIDEMDAIYHQRTKEGARS
jgi:hypothetical protein